jgi:hypothetical protein
MAYGARNGDTSPESTMPTTHRLSSIVTLCCMILAGCPALADTGTAAADREPAAWQKHVYSFAFMGFTSTYSCDGLADKLKLLLIAAGARPDVKSRAGACASGFGRPDKFARADLTFYTLAPAALVTPDKPADGAPVNGAWIPVTLSYEQPRQLGRGDCELVEQFRANVLPMFHTRNFDDHTTCIPHQESGSVIDLKFEALAAPAKVDPAKHG